MGAKKLKPKKSVQTSDRDWNVVMQKIEKITKEADKKLEEISAACLNRACNVRSR